MHRYRARPNLRRQRLQKEISFLYNFCLHTQHTALYPRGWAEGRLGPVLIRLWYKASDKALCSVLPGSLLRMSWGGGRGGGNRETAIQCKWVPPPPPPVVLPPSYWQGFGSFWTRSNFDYWRGPETESFRRIQNLSTGSRIIRPDLTTTKYDRNFGYQIMDPDPVGSEPKIS